MNAVRANARCKRCAVPKVNEDNPDFVSECRKKYTNTAYPEHEWIGDCSVCGAKWSQGWSAMKSSTGDLVLAAVAHQHGVDEKDITNCMVALGEFYNCPNDMAALGKLLTTTGTLAGKAAVSAAKAQAMNYVGKTVTNGIIDYLGKDLVAKLAKARNMVKLKVDLPAGNIGGKLLDMAGLPKAIEIDVVEKLKRYAMAKCREKLGQGFTDLDMTHGAGYFNNVIGKRRRMLGDLSPAAKKGSSGRRLAAKNFDRSFVALALAIEDQGFVFCYD